MSRLVLVLVSALALLVVAASALPVHRPLRLLEARARSEISVDAGLGAGASAAVGVSLSQDEIWQEVVRVCSGLSKDTASGRVDRCGFGMLAQLYDEIYTQDKFSTWPSSVATVRLGLIEKQRMSTFRAGNKIQGKLNSDTLSGPAKVQFLAIPLTLPEIAQRVHDVFTKDWTPAVGVQGTKRLNSAEEAEQTPRFTYQYNAASQLMHVAGAVINGPSTAAKDGGFCRVLWDLANGAIPTDQSSFNLWPSHTTTKPDAIMDIGHIVAASLGGSNCKVQNFMPQIGYSNRGAYGNAEHVAQDVRDWLLIQKPSARDCVRIAIDLAYATVPLIPSGGVYTVSWNPNCGDIQRLVVDECRFVAPWSNPQERIIPATQIAQVLRSATTYSDQAAPEPAATFHGSDPQLCTDQLRAVRRWSQLVDAKRIFDERAAKAPPVRARVHQGYPTPGFDPKTVREQPILQANQI